MSADEERQPQAPASHAEGEPPRGKNRRSGQRRGPRHEEPVEERRHRLKSSDRAGANGFRDGLEHALCEAMRHFLPPTGVIFARTGVATMTHPVVARRDGALLQCDLQHDGPHIWPDGELVPRADG